MSQVVKIYALFLGSALLMFGGGLQGLLLSVRGAEEGFSLLSLGLIGTGWSVGFVTGSIIVPMLVKRVGHIRSYAVMAAVGGITILLNLLWISDVGWIVLRIFSGFCFAGAAMIVESWLNEVADNKSRGTMFSFYVTVNMTASTAGQLVMSVTGTAGYLPFVLGALAFMGAILPTALTSSPQPQPLRSVSLDIGLLYKTSPIAVIASFAVGMANGTFGTLAPVFGYRQGLPASQVALLMSAPVIAGALAQIPFGRLSDFVDRRIVLISASLAAAALGLAMLIFNPSGGPELYTLFALYGAVALPIYAVAVAHANDFAREGNFAKVASGMLLVLGTGLAIGPVVASFAMNAIGPVGLFAVTAVFHAGLAIVAFVRMRIRPIRDAEGRVRFRPLSVIRMATPESVGLDPRTETEIADGAADEAEDESAREGA